ncbi:hypothetical protein QUB56_10445 [Microcoleus sp. AR_TQ3_B6]|uniref:phospholipase D-like domain-containing protein n=1 Tax=Microcoleus sp. AR_TQ3_B6 TaxID=3055284 RepID=UPI002FCFF48F
MKAINASLSSEVDIAGFLGLEPSIIRDAMINLRMSEDIDLIAPDGSLMQVWKLTKKGEGTLRDAKIIVPEERTFDINFDGLLRCPRWYGRLESRLLKQKDLRNQEIIEIEPSPKKPPELSDLKLKDVDAIIRQIEGASKAKFKQDRDLLALKAIERRQRFFQPALLLIYKAKDSDDIQVTFAIDGVLSNEHEAAFARANGVKKLRLLEALRESAPRKLAEEVLGHEFVAQAPLQEAEALKEEVSSAQAKIDTDRNSVAEAETDEDKAALEQKIIEQEQEIEILKQRLNSFQISYLEVYDHPEILKQAIQDSQKRLMIISPWIRGNVVKKQFIEQLEKLLKCNIQLLIGYGLGKDEDDKKYPSDIQAEKNLKKLANQYKDNFILKRLGNTHAKILISDAKFAVVTSFNWLSFKGDRDRTFRDERGTLVSDPQKIDELFDSYRSRFND